MSSSTNNEDDEEEIKLKLCRKLCRQLFLSQDKTLISTTQQKLSPSSSSTTTDALFAKIAAEQKNHQYVAHVLSGTLLNVPKVIQHAFTAGGGGGADLSVLQCVFVSTSEQEESWTDDIQSILSTATSQFKAKPETLIATMSSLLQALVNVSSVASLPLMKDELLPALVKQLKSSKENVRASAAQGTLSVSHMAILAKEPELLNAILTAGAQLKSVTQVPVRVTFYTLLKDIAKLTTTADGVSCLDAQLVSNVLVAIAIPLAKETKSSVAAREQGSEALVRWMGLSSCSADAKGYKDAVSLLQKAILAKNSPDALLYLSKLCQALRVDDLQAIVGDLMKDSKVGKGLDALMEAANKKHSSSSSIPQVEGLLAAYVWLVYATTTSTDSNTKLSSVAETALSAGTMGMSKTSFVYGTTTQEACGSGHLVVGLVLGKLIPLYLQYDPKAATVLQSKPKAGLTQALASVLCHSAKNEELQSMLESQTKADALVQALLSKVNGAASLNSSSIRTAATTLSAACTAPESSASCLLLMHIGGSADDATTTKALEKSASPSVDSNAIDAMASLVATYACQVDLMSGDDKESSGPISLTAHQAALRLLTSLGTIASEYDEEDEDGNDSSVSLAHHLCMACSKSIAQYTQELKESITVLSEEDVGIYLSETGTLYSSSDDTKASSTASKPKVSKSRMTEEEAWELQMKQELEAKKKQSSSQQLSAEQKKLVQEQDAKRDQIDRLVTEHAGRVFAAIESLANSDLSIGNASLVALSEHLVGIAASSCLALLAVESLQRKSSETLQVLATCVYEIDEEHAPMLAQALVKAYQGEESKTTTTDSSLQVSAFSSPCEPAATTIFELDEYGEELSANSFIFLLPVIQAALMGPRTTPGCEGALRVLERHCVYLAGDEKKDLVLSKRLRMIGAVLELLQHDRAQRFVDPSPVETLIACYSTDDTLSTAELAPLLDERGALANTPQARRTAMTVLGHILASSTTSNLIQSNPLMENRIWMNCFATDEGIQREAKRTWRIAHGAEEAQDDTSPLPPPSPIFAVPMMALLSHSDASISAAAAKALAHGLANHPKSCHGAIEKICTTYIDSFPTQSSSGDDASKSNSPFPTVPSIPAKKATPAAIPKKKPTNTLASLKKKSAPKSALAVAGIGGPKKTKKKSSALSSAMLKPKQERTVDLASQFTSSTTKAAMKQEEDSPTKIATRIGDIESIDLLSH